MGSKTKKKQQEEKWSEAVAQIIEYAVAGFLLAIMIIVPFYTRNGYFEIGDAKFAAYKVISIMGYIVLIPLGMIYALTLQSEAKKKGMAKDAFLNHVKGYSITDWFVYVYLLFVILSIISGGYYKDALWGYEGWYMGFLSQLSFVLLYVFVSGFSKYWKAAVYIGLGVSFIVFVFGILHRLMIDPLGFYEGIDDVYKAQFISTLGQTSWYGSFVAVLLPIGIGIFIFTKSKVLTVLGGIYVFVGFCTMTTENSDSAYMSLAAFMLVFLWKAITKKEELLRYLWVIVLFLLAGKYMGFMQKRHPNTLWGYDYITNFILYGKVCYVFLVIICVLCVAGTVFYHKWNLKEKTMILIRNSVFVITAVAVITIVCLIVLKAKGALPESVSGKLSQISYMNWNDDWGNARGQTWRFTAEMYQEESLIHKLFGVGPDCYYSYASTGYRDRLVEMWGERALTNAHNELLNMLITSGLFGMLAYAGIFVTAIKRFLQKSEQNSMLIVFAASIASYMAYNFFCYQQVLCTPFVFIIIGMGEYLLRKKV